MQCLVKDVDGEFILYGGPIGAGECNMLVVVEYCYFNLVCHGSADGWLNSYIW